MALPTLLNAVQMATAFTRQAPERVIGDAGFAVPNLADLLVGGPTLLGQTNFFNGPIGLSPAMATFLLALPLTAFVRWRDALGRPGVLTALLLTVAAVSATQLPTVAGLFRYPFRYLVVVQIALPVLVLLSLSAASAFTRPRARVAGGLLAVQLLLAVVRAPALWHWHTAAAVLTAVALLLVLLAAGQDRRTTSAAAACGLVLRAGSAPVLGERTMVEVQARQNAERGFTGATGQPYRDIGVPGQSGADALGRTTEEFRARSVVAGRTATVYAWGPFADVFGPDRGWSKGFFPGNANLLAGATVGTGYVTSPHTDLDPILCTSYIGSVGCGERRELEVVPGTSRPWIDVLAADTVLLSTTAPEQVRSYFDGRWESVRRDEVWLEYSRAPQDRLPGRVAATDGAVVSPDGWSAGLARVGRPQETYTVTTGAAGGGTLLLRVPYWPGYRATLDGVDVPVVALSGALVQVALPPGVDEGRLELWFDPIGARLLAPALSAGLAVILLNAAVAGPLSRRPTRRDRGSRRPDHGTAVPSTGWTVQQATAGESA